MEGAVSSASMSTALTAIWEIAGDAMDFISGNTVLFTIFCCSVIPIGFGIIRRAKRASH